MSRLENADMDEFRKDEIKEMVCEIVAILTLIGMFITLFSLMVWITCLIVKAMFF